MKNKKQVLVIHGGDFFDTREEFVQSLKQLDLDKEGIFRLNATRWRDNLQSDLGDRFEVYLPKMPLGDDARYSEWKLWFEKMIPFLRGGAVLIGHSLGGIFLARYLSEHAIPFKAGAVFLIAAPYFAPDKKKGMEANAGFSVGDDLSKLASSASHIFVYHSKDDDIVPFAHASEYMSRMPSAQLVSFKDKGHFRLKRFPELVKAIKGLFDK
jgi:uncharacterized protein